ncbi:MAG: carboxypeptidase regulatory-like domain-containing protein [Natronomonas sp.]
MNRSEYSISIGRIILVTIFLAGLLAVAPAVTAAEGNDADIIVDEPGADLSTNHYWDLTVDSEVTGVEKVKVDYSSSGIDLSSQDIEYLQVSIGSEKPGMQVVDSSNNGEVLEITFYEPQTLRPDETLTVETYGDKVDNPGTGSYTASISLIDEKNTLVSEQASFEIQTASLYIDNAATDVKSTHEWDIVADSSEKKTLETIELDYTGTSIDVSRFDGLSSSDEIPVSIGGSEYPISGDDVEANDDVISLEIGEDVDQDETVSVSGLGEIKNPGVGTIEPAMRLLESEGNTITEGNAKTEILESGTIEGSVTKSDGSSLNKNVPVKVYNATTNNYIASEDVDSNGDYTIDVPAHQLRVEVDVDGYLKESETQDVPDSTTTIDFELSEAVEATGKITDRNGNGLDGATISASGPVEAFNQTDANGNYKLDLAPGQYNLYVDHESYKDRWEPEVDVASSSDIGDISLEPISYINGTVVDESGNPIQADRVFAYDPSFTSYADNLTVDSNGEFSLEVGSGTYTVEAENTGYPNAREEDVEVDADDEVEIEIELPEPAGIEGRVTNEAGGVENAFVVADDGSNFYYDQTDGDGDYQIDAAEGSYQVIVYADGQAGAGQSVDVDAGSTESDVDFELEKTEILHSSVDVIEDGTDSVSEGNIGFSADLQNGIMISKLTDTNNNQQKMPHDLEDLGVNDETEFEIQITATNYTPSSLMWGASDVDWETTDNATNDDAIDITVTTKPVNLQGNDSDPQKLPIGPLMTRSPSEVQWPSKADDDATIGWNQTVYFGLFDLATAPPDVRDNLNGMTVTTNAQTFAPPRVEDDALKVWVAAPNRTVDGDLHEGFYEAHIPDTQLDSWGVDDPEDDLDALYRGDSTDFTVEETDGGAWIKIDNIGYSAGTIEVAPDETDTSESPPEVGSVSANTGSTAEDEDDEETPEPTPEDETPEPTPDQDTPEPTTETESPEPTEDSTATESGGADTPVPDDQPGFGPVAAIVAFVAVGLLTYRRWD